MNLVVGVGYDTDIPIALRTVYDLLRENTHVLNDPEPLVQISCFGESSVKISVCPWVKVEDYPAVIGEVNIALLEAFRRRGINIPYPQLELKVLGGAGVGGQ